MKTYFWLTLVLLCLTNGHAATEKSMKSKKDNTPLHATMPFQSPCGIKLTAIPPNNPLIFDFATKTAIQTFTYDYKNVSLQFHELENCYTKTGWESFHNAIQQAGNIKAATREKLIVMSKSAGETKLLSSDPTALVWKMMVPIEVLYQNKTHHLTQRLNVKMVIVIENKQLGIDQIIASAAPAPKPIKPVDEEETTSNQSDKDTKAREKSKG